MIQIGIIKGSFFRTIINFANLPYKAYISLKAIIKTLLPSIKGYIPSIKEKLKEDFIKNESSNIEEEGDYLAYVSFKDKDELFISTAIYTKDHRLRKVVSTKNLEDLIMSILNSI